MTIRWDYSLVCLPVVAHLDRMVDVAVEHRGMVLASADGCAHVGPFDEVDACPRQDGVCTRDYVSPDYNACTLAGAVAVDYGDAGTGRGGACSWASRMLH